MRLSIDAIQATTVAQHISRSYPVLGVARHYEIDTSLAYAAATKVRELQFTCNGNSQIMRDHMLNWLHDRDVSLSNSRAISQDLVELIQAGVILS